MSDNETTEGAKEKQKKRHGLQKSEEKRDRMITFRAKASEFRAMRFLANQADMNMSDFILWKTIGVKERDDEGVR